MTGGALKLIPTSSESSGPAACGMLLVVTLYLNFLIRFEYGGELLDRKSGVPMIVMFPVMSVLPVRSAMM